MWAIAMIMFGQFFVAKYDVEEQLSVEEGQTITYARDIRQTELAVVDSSDERVEDVVVVPRSLLLASETKAGLIVAAAADGRRAPD